jgi:uncharacterized membrane protein YbhN (UPF0104 family)
MVVLIAATVGGALWYLRERGFAWSEFWATFRQLRPGWIAAAALLALSTYLGRAYRWRVLIHPMKPDASLWNLFSATAIGFTAIVLFGRPGELVRPYLIATKERLSFSSQLAAWMLERIYDLLMALLIFGIALSRVRASGVQVGPRIQWVLEVGGYAVGVVAIICIAVLLLLRLFNEPMRQRLMDGLGFLPERYLARVETFVTAFTHGVRSTHSHWYVIQILLWSILEWIIIVGCYWCLFQAAPNTLHFSLMDVLIFVGFVSFGAVVQIPGIGGGMQLVSIVVLTELFQFTLESATGLAVLLWSITFVVIVPIGLILAFHDGLKWSRLRQISANAGESTPPGVPPPAQGEAS